MDIVTDHLLAMTRPQTLFQSSERKPVDRSPPRSNLELISGLVPKQTQSIKSQSVKSQSRNTVEHFKTMSTLDKKMDALYEEIQMLSGKIDDLLMGLQGQ